MLTLLSGQNYHVHGGLLLVVVFFLAFSLRSVLISQGRGKDKCSELDYGQQSNPSLMSHGNKITQSSLTAVIQNWRH